MLRNKKNVRSLLLLITYGLLLHWALNHMSRVFGMLGSVYAVISPFVLGFCIAFVLNVVMRPMERLWSRFVPNGDKLRRPVCIMLSLFLFIGVVFAILFILIPQIETTVFSIRARLPAFTENVERWWQDASAFLSHYGAKLPQLELNGDESSQWLAGFLSDLGSGVVNTTMHVTTSIISGIVDFVLALVFSIYLLAQKEALCRQLKKLIQAFLPEGAVNWLLHLAMLANRSFTNFVTGQLTEAVIIGVLCFVGMLLLGMPYALVISVLVGFTALIPVFGAFIGTAVGVLLILLVDPMKALWFVVFILVLQQLEGNLIYPRVVGKSVGLPGVWVLFAVTVGSSIGGIVGMLLSVPICSLLYVLLKELVEYRLREQQEE